jgi:hypothetical protein
MQMQSKSEWILSAHPILLLPIESDGRLHSMDDVYDLIPACESFPHNFAYLWLAIQDDFKDGYDLFAKMKVLVRAKKKIKSRFPCYRPEQLYAMTRELYNLRVAAIKGFCEESRNGDGNNVSTEHDYHGMLHEYTQGRHGFGPLMGHHFLQILSRLGLLPPWIQQCAKLTSNSKSVAYFFPKFGITIHQKQCDVVLELLTAGLQKRMGMEDFNRCFTENLMCKAYRLKGGGKSDKSFADLYVKHQPLFNFCGRQVKIRHRILDYSDSNGVRARSSSVGCRNEGDPCCYKEQVIVLNNPLTHFSNVTTE